MSNPWFRMYSEFANDPIVQSLAFDDQRHYVMILCMKCQGVLDRKLPPLNRERIILRGIGLDEVTANEVKRRLMDVGFIYNNWQPVSWDKRQFKSDSSTERSRKLRKNKESKTVAGTNRYASVSVSVSDSVVVSNKKSKKFKAPSMQEVICYCLENGYPGTLGEKIFDYYNTADWKDSTGKPVKSWKQKCIAVWFKPENKEKSQQTQLQKTTDAFKNHIKNS